MPLPNATSRRNAPIAALASVAALVAIAALSAPARAQEHAEGAPVQATLVCERATAPGRVRCEVEVRASTGTLAWGDVVVVAIAPSLTPLRARVGAPEATMSTSSLWRFTFAVAAKQRGTAKLEAHVRLVHCDGEKCAPLVVPVRADVVIAP